MVIIRYRYCYHLQVHFYTLPVFYIINKTIIIVFYHRQLVDSHVLSLAHSASAANRPINLSGSAKCGNDLKYEGRHVKVIINLLVVLFSCYTLYIHLSRTFISASPVILFSVFTIILSENKIFVDANKTSATRH